MRQETTDTWQALDENQRVVLESAAFRRLIAHLQGRTDLQNIDMMEHFGFCRNCFSRWLFEAGEGLDLKIEDAKRHVYGMDAEEWKARYQTGPKC